MTLTNANREKLTVYNEVKRNAMDFFNEGMKTRISEVIQKKLQVGMHPLHYGYFREVDVNPRVNARVGGSRDVSKSKPKKGKNKF